MEQLIFQWFENGGTAAYFAFLTIYNIIIIPFPNEAIFVIAPILFKNHFIEIIILSNVSAIVSAAVTYDLGARYGKRAKEFVSSRGPRYAASIETVKTYGWLAAALSAVTPLPFSAVCWACGIVRTSFYPYLVAVLLTRIPRNTIMCMIAWNLY